MWFELFCFLHKTGEDGGKEQVGMPGVSFICHRREKLGPCPKGKCSSARRASEDTFLWMGRHSIPIVRKYLV